MTNWMHKVDLTTARRISYGDQTAISVWDKGNDYQRGDTIDFSREVPWLRGEWEITHVIKNQNGIDDGYAVLCLKAPDADYWKQRALQAESTVQRLTRSNASLRGQITKIRRRWVSSAGEKS